MDTAPTVIAGLSGAEAQRRLAAEGPNILPGERARGLFPLVFGLLREPMFLLLIGAASIYLVLGDVREALVLAASIVVVMAITVVQERRTERTLERLRDLSSPRALVVRDGRECRIAGSEVVRGDLLLLREGDRVPADARVLVSHDLLVDESLLTGESVPVAKGADESHVYSGTLVVKGTAQAEVTAIGVRSELGRIGATLSTVDSGKTSLERETARMVRYFALGGLALCVVVAALYIATRGDTLAGILAGLTLAMALLPEEFPVVLTVFLALGAWRIAQHGVLTRRMPAIEMLGAATVLCCDKTGTLTENRMTVVEAWLDGTWRAARAWDVAETPLLNAAARACERSPFDPMERAILAAAERLKLDGGERRDAAGDRHYPMEGEFLAVCKGWRLESGHGCLAMKGAPETVVGICELSAGDRDAALASASAAADRGLRVLAVAQAHWSEAPWLEDPRDYPWRFLGFVALADPIRGNVPAAIALCRRAGIRVVMITGDHPATACAIARQAGLDANEVVTGATFEAMDEPSLAAAAARVQVFARVRPEQKLRLVQALRAAGEIVAMTGDGVNDAPALKAAHIGVAMGKRGTDVAREAAALVLLEDDFTSIVGTVRLGRRIYDNIRNAMRYLVAVHVPMAGMAFLPLVTGWPIFVFPVHVVFLEFVIDPACSLVFEAERSDPRIMERPPRPTSERLFTARSLALGVLLGASVLAAVAIVYGWALAGGMPEGKARAAAFATLVFGNLALIFANRSHTHTLFEAATHQNPAAWWVVGATLAALAASLFVPAAAGIFRFEAIGTTELGLAAAAGLGSVLWYDALKVIRRRQVR